MAAIELEVRGDSAVRLDVAGQTATEWGGTEYIPMVSTALPDWGGPYSVTPRLAEQTLATTDHVMRDDLTVEGIPSYRTTNIGGGYTVVIAQD